MNKQQLDRLMRIARKTGSPVIILDENKDEMVLLPLVAYEHLVDDALIGVESFDDYINEGLEDSIDLDQQELSDEPIINSDQIQVNQSVDESKPTERFDEEQFYLEPIE